MNQTDQYSKVVTTSKYAMTRPQLKHVYSVCGHGNSTEFQSSSQNQTGHRIRCNTGREEECGQVRAAKKGESGFK